MHTVHGHMQFIDFSRTHAILCISSTVHFHVFVCSSPQLHCTDWTEQTQGISNPLCLDTIGMLIIVLVCLKSV